MTVRVSIAGKNIIPFHVVAVLAFFLLFFSCNNPATPVTEEFSYPLRIGNKWEYAYTMTGINYRVPINDSVFVPKDTQISLGSSKDFVSVDRVDSTSFSVVTFVIRDSSVVTGDTITSVGHSWYRNAADGLYEYAIDFPGGPLASPKRAAAAGAVYRFKGRLFSFPGEMTNFIAGDLSPFSAKRIAASAGIIAYDPPRVIYRFPYKAGTIWDVVNNISDSTRLARQYLTKESITTPAGTFECYKVKWFWDLNHDGIWDTDQEGYDWVSPTHGLVKRQLIYRNFEETYIDPNDLSNTIIVIAKFDWVEEYTLIGTNMR
jgi:hypothetical protein